MLSDHQVSCGAERLEPRHVHAGKPSALDHRAGQTTELELLARFEVMEHPRPVISDSLGSRHRPPMLTGGVQASVTTTARTSSISAAASERDEVQQISASVALVSTHAGLDTALPISFSHTCAQMSSTMGGLIRASASTPAQTVRSARRYQ